MATSSSKPAAKTARPSAKRKFAGRPFLGLIDPVLVEGPVEFDFDGAIASDDAEAVWMWMARDLAPDLIDIDKLDDSPESAAAIESLMPDLLVRARNLLTEAETNRELDHRIKTQVGGEDVWDRLPVVLNALRCRGLLDKAQGFGRAANTMPDETALVLALQAMPLNDPPVLALLLQAAVGQVAVPSKLITAAIKIAGGPTEQQIARAGLTPLVDAILSHSQNQIPALTQMGTFGDMDLICRAVDRFHRLMRALTGYVEFPRGSRVSNIAAMLTTAISDRLEPKLRDVAPDVNKAMRRREGTDRLDGDLVLSALNGIYLLAAVRDSRDSLAVNALFDQVWSQTGQALEIHVERLLEQVRMNPGDRVVSARLDAALKLSEVRFGQDFADTLRRAKEKVERRA